MHGNGLSRLASSGILAPVLLSLAAIAAGMTLGGSLAAAPAKTTAAVRLTLLIIPFQNRTSSDQEYAWIGDAASEMISTHAIASNAAPTLPLSAVNAYVRKRDLTFDTLREGQGAVAAARTLGADLLISGSFQASWPDVEITAWVTGAKDGAVQKKFHAQGHLEQLIPLLEDVTAQLFKALAWPAPKHAALGTTDLYAFREAMLGLEILSLQNYGPRQHAIKPVTSLKVAKLHCEKAIELQKKWAIALGCAAAANALLGESEDPAQNRARAVELADRAKSGTGFSQLAPLAAYHALANKGDKAQALVWVQQAAERYPAFLSALACTGEHLQSVEDHAAARKVFERFLHSSPDNPYALAKLGKSLARLKDGSQALALTQKAVDKAPGEVEFLVDLGSRQIDLGQYAEATATLEKAIATEKRDARAYLRLGYLHLLEKQPDKAIAILNRSISVANLDEEWRTKAIAYYDLARAHGQKKAIEEAFKALELAVQSGYEDASAFAKEPDFEPLKADPRWGALLTRVQR